MPPSTAPDSDSASIFSYASSSSSATSIGDSAAAFPHNEKHGLKRSRVTSFSSTISVQPPGSTQIILPRTLLKPKLKEVTREAIAAVDPELANVPLSYIIRSLKTIGPNMMTALARTTAPAPISLPRELTVSVKQEIPTSPSSTVIDPPPTHLLAVYARSSASAAASKTMPRRKVTLFPTHAIVLAAHCAHLPALPPGVKFASEKVAKTPNDIPAVSDGKVAGKAHEVPLTPLLPLDEDATPKAGTSQLPQIFRSPERTENLDITLPVVPLCIPSPSMFPILQAYLYTKRVDHLLGTLLPNTPALRCSRESTPTLSSTSDVAPSVASPISVTHPQTNDQIASASGLVIQLAETQSIYALTRAALRIHELWANVAALGVFDDRLWLTISFAWHVLIGALEKSQQSQVPTKPGDECASDSDSSTHSKEDVRNEPGLTVPDAENILANPLVAPTRHTQ